MAVGRACNEVDKAIHNILALGHSIVVVDINIAFCNLIGYALSDSLHQSNFFK